MPCRNHYAVVSDDNIFALANQRNKKEVVVFLCAQFFKGILVIMPDGYAN